MGSHTARQKANEHSHSQTFHTLRHNSYQGIIFWLAVAVCVEETHFPLLFNAERKCLTLRSFVPLRCFLLLYPPFHSLPQPFISSLVKTPEPYGVIFPHPAPLYHINTWSQPHTPSNPTHSQLEPVDLTVSKRSSSVSSSSSPPCSSASSPASSRSSPPSPYSTTSRASPHRSPPHSQLRSSPSHTLPPHTSSLLYPTIGPGVVVSPVVLPLPFLPLPLHLHQPIMVNPPVASDDNHPRSREPKIGETL